MHLGIADDEVLQVLEKLIRSPWSFNADIPICAIETLRHFKINDIRLIQYLKDLLKISQDSQNNPDAGSRLYIANVLVSLGAKDNEVIQALKILMECNSKFRFGAAETLINLGIKDDKVIQALRQTLMNSQEYNVFGKYYGKYHQNSIELKLKAIELLGSLGIKDNEVMQSLSHLLKNSDPIVRRKVMQLFTVLDTQTIELGLDALSHEKNPEVLYETYVSLLRIKPEDYINYLANDKTDSELLYLFISAVYLQGVELSRHGTDLFLRGKAVNLSAEQLEILIQQKQRFIQNMANQAQILNTLNTPINAPTETNVFAEDFLTANLPAENPSKNAQAIENLTTKFEATEIIIDVLRDEVSELSKKVDYIAAQMQQAFQQHWNSVQAIIDSDEPIYVKDFKRELVQTYIVALVVSSNEVMVNPRTEIRVISMALKALHAVLYPILLPFGVVLPEFTPLSLLLETADTVVKMKRMSRIKKLGATPEAVAMLATQLGNKLLKCTDIEYTTNVVDLGGLFNCIKNLVCGANENRFYLAVFDSLTNSGWIGDITHRLKKAINWTESELHTRGMHDAQLLLAAVMEVDVPTNEKNQVDINGLFLYTSPFVTTVDCMFTRTVQNYCDKQEYPKEVRENLTVSGKAKFCTLFAEQCHKHPSAVVDWIEGKDRTKNLEKLASHFGQIPNIFQPKKGLVGYLTNSTQLCVKEDELKDNVVQRFLSAN